MGNPFPPPSFSFSFKITELRWEILAMFCYDPPFQKLLQGIFSPQKLGVAPASREVLVFLFLGFSVDFSSLASLHLFDE